MIKKRSQMDRVKNHMRLTGGITSWEAIMEFGATRLSAIIYDLKNTDGLKITKVTITQMNRYNEEVRFARYSFDMDDPKTRESLSK